MKADILSSLKTQKGKFALGLFLATATIAAGIGLMSTSGYLISRAAQRPMIVDLFMVTAAVRFFGISRAVVRYFERVISHDLTFRILQSIRIVLFERLRQRPLAWLMGKRPGDLLARMISNIETLQNVYLRFFAPVAVALIISLLTFTALWFFDPAIALATLALLALNGAMVPLLALKLAKGRGKADVALKANMKSLLVDRLQGMQDLLWMNRKQEALKEVVALQAETDRLQRKNAGASGLLEGLNSLFSNISMLAVLLIASPLILAGQLQGVMLAMLTLGVLSSFEAVQPLGQAFLFLENNREAYRRIASAAARENLTQAKQAADSLPQTHAIAFEKVSFSYAPEHLILSNISLEIAQGSKTAIVGPTGSGKSTIINILLRLWEADQGKISIGANDIAHYDPEKIRSLFALVSQDAYIFNRSLRDNLLIANPEASEEELKKILETVGLAPFAQKLEKEPGSLGMKLSGGERQLLALARAMLKNAPIWIFDEPTANLDVNTERRILDQIWAHCGPRTMIMITHRLLDMEKMDQIIVMHQGQIVERGKHRELLENQSLYAQMYKTQQQLIG